MKTFHEAAAIGDIQKLESLLKSQMAEKDGINQREELTGKTALHRAAEAGHIKVVAWLLQKNANINATDKEENTPLCLAAGKCNLQMVECLLNNKAKTVLRINFFEPSKTPLVNMPTSKYKEMEKEALKLADKIKKINGNPIELAKKAVEIAQVKEFIEFSQKYETINKLIRVNVQTDSIELARPFGQLGIAVLPDGTIRFTTIEETYKLAKATGSTDKLKLMTNIPTPLKAVQGMQIVKEELGLMLPPLIFFVQHDENYVFEFLIKNNCFQHLGYKTICFELDQGVSLAENMRLMEQTMATAENDKAASKELLEAALHNKLMHNFCKHIESQPELQYVGIDTPLGKDRCLEKTAMMSSPEVNKKREENFVQEWSKASKKSFGGTITIVGLGHFGMQNELMKLVPEYMQNCLFYYFYCETSWIKKVGADFTKLTFPLGVKGFDMAKGYSEAEQTFQAEMSNKRAILIEKAMANAKLKEYQKISMEDTTISKQLKALTNLPFAVAVTEAYCVDALLPIDKMNMTAMVSSLQKIQQTLNLNAGYPAEMIKTAENSYALIIPRINQQNAKIIDAAYFDRREKEVLKPNFKQ